jgi:NADPH:quinone reductase-like Zn-dependent oxidoreductase
MPNTKKTSRRYVEREIPLTMQAAEMERTGPASVLKLHEVPTPKIGANDVLIEVDTAGVGSWDPSMRSGEWQEYPLHFPVVLGSDGSGTVVARGSKVRRLDVGDRVYAYDFDTDRTGFYAEYVAVPAKNAARIPRGLDLRRAGAAPAIALTALQGVDDALHVKRGERVVIIGASGNVGMLALQFAKRRGAKVLAIASGRDGVRFARGLGADAAVDGKRGNVNDALVRFAPEGVDAILAFVGGKLLTTCMDALAPGGRVAYPNGIDPTPRKRRGVKMTAYDAEGGQEEFARLNRAVEDAHLRIPIAQELPLSRAAQAHQRVEKGHMLGRVVLRANNSRG